MNPDRPIVVLIAGPNGAGKSTLAPALLSDVLDLKDYVNADTIAQGLSAFAPETQAFRAGRIMLSQLKALSSERRSFSFESTLATKSYAPWLVGLVEQGYLLRLVFLSLPSPEAAIARVEARVRAGGHSVPESTIRRRFQRGLRNLESLYSPIAAEWSVLDNAHLGAPKLLASGSGAESIHILDKAKWQALMERADV